MPPRRLPKPSRSFCSRMPLTPTLRQPEDCRAPSSFFVYVLVCWPHGHVNKQITLLQMFVKVK
jgi:hypothetical protein